MYVKTHKVTQCETVGELRHALEGIPDDIVLQCYCSNIIKVKHEYNQDNPEEQWIELDSQ